MKKGIGEINIRKLRFDEAKLKLMKELDALYLQNVTKVKILHGKGSGKLREMTREYLKKQFYVESFSDAEYFEGGSGITIVKFK